MVLWEFDTDNMIFKSYNNTVNGMSDSYITLNSLKKIIHPDDIKKVYDRLSSLEMELMKRVPFISECGMNPTSNGIIVRQL